MRWKSVATNVLVLALAGLPAKAPALTGPPPPEVRRFHGVSYLTGGVGAEEEQALRRLGKADDLQLVFARRNGEYLADVDVTIAGPGGKRVLQAAADGPWLFTELPRGRYVVTAEFEGQVRGAVAQVTPGQQRRLYLDW
jgi:hypothetical protein